MSVVSRLVVPISQLWWVEIVIRKWQRPMLSFLLGGGHISRHGKQMFFAGIEVKN